MEPLLLFLNCKVNGEQSEEKRLFMKSKRFLLKLIILAVIYLIVWTVISIIDPITKNVLAAEQMNINSLSSTWIVLYKRFTDHISLFMTVITLLIFIEDIVSLVKRIIKK